jgi:stringent starvation protein B
MIPTRPYLIRAIYEWAGDNNFTPHLLVDASQAGVIVPIELVEDNKIILNIANGAVANLSLGDDFISFSARFSGVSREIFVPTPAVRAIYARENGIGIVLPEDAEGSEIVPESEPTPPTRPSGPNLRVVK